MGSFVELTAVDGAKIPAYVAKPEGAPRLRPLGDGRHDAPVVCPQELPEHQRGGEPRLRMVLPRGRLPQSGKSATANLDDARADANLE